MADTRSIKELKVIINIYDYEDHSKADDSTSSEDEPMEPMRDHIKRKTVAKKAHITKADSDKATKLKVTNHEEPAAKSAKWGRAGTQFGRSPIVICKQSDIRAKNTKLTLAEQDDWLAIPGFG